MPRRFELPAIVARCCRVLAGVFVLFAGVPVACVTHAADVSPGVLSGAGEPDIDAAHWSAICSERAGTFQRFSAEDLDQLQDRLQGHLDDLARVLPWNVQDDRSWHNYLMWKESHRLAVGDPLSDAVLDELEIRWFNASRVCEAGELAATADVALRCVRARRSTCRQETPEQQAAAWNQLAELLEEPASLTRAERQTAAEVLWERERLGQSSPVTASVRRALSKPNLIVQVRKAWFETQHAVDVDEPFNTRGLFAGADTIATGRLTGSTSCRLVPSLRGAEWSLSFHGQSNSSSVSYDQGARVNSRAATTVAGEKRFRLSAVGMASDPADATASTTLTYGQICAKGLRFRRRVARARALARRPIAEEDTSRSVCNSVCTRLNDVGREAAESFNRTYVSFRDRFASAGRMVPHVQIRVDNEWLNWESRLEGKGGFAAPQDAPLFETTAPLVVHIAASALEEYAVARIGKKRCSQEDLAETIAGMFATRGDVPPTDEPFEVEFAPQPLRVRLQDDQLSLSLFISAFESGGTSFPAMTVDVDYAFRLRDDGVAFVREGNPRVKPLATGDGGAGQNVTGRQQTLRLVAQRKLSRVLGAELLWPGLAVSITDAPDRFRVSKLRAHDDWLQLALTTE